MDPVLMGIIRNYKNMHGETLPAVDDIGEFTNRIIISKRDDKRYFLRMVVMRLDNEFCVL